LLLDEGELVLVLIQLTLRKLNVLDPNEVVRKLYQRNCGVAVLTASEPQDRSFILDLYDELGPHQDLKRQLHSLKFDEVT